MIQSKDGNLKVHGDIDTVLDDLTIIIFGLKKYFNIEEILRAIKNGDITATHKGYTIEERKDSIEIIEEG